MSERPTLVQKFGGTSVSTAERRSQVVEHVRRARDEGYRVAIVVSAMGRQGDPYATDTLLDLLRGDDTPVDRRDYDMIFICGEIISSTVMSHLLKREGIPAAGLTGAQARIYTDDNHGEAEIIEIDPARVRQHIARGEVPVIAGCQGVIRSSGDYTTLGRGGSDTSGVAMGVALDADRVEIYTDVEGVARVDPRLVPEAQMLDRISYEKMHEMARFGAGVVHPRAVRRGWDGRVPVVVRSTFSTAPGTIIAEIQDEHALLGIATLGPWETVVLEPDSVDPETRRTWERQQGIMSLVEDRDGAIILGVPAEKSYELEALLDQAELDAQRSLQDQCWISLIGEAQALREDAPTIQDLFGREEIVAAYSQMTDRRITYVVPASHEARAAQALYHHVLEVT